MNQELVFDQDLIDQIVTETIEDSNIDDTTIENTQIEKKENKKSIFYLDQFLYDFISKYFENLKNTNSILIYPIEMMLNLFYLYVMTGIFLPLNLTGHYVVIMTMYLLTLELLDYKNLNEVIYKHLFKVEHTHKKLIQNKTWSTILVTLLLLGVGNIILDKNNLFNLFSQFSSYLITL